MKSSKLRREAAQVSERASSVFPSSLFCAAVGLWAGGLTTLNAFPV